MDEATRWGVDGRELAKAKRKAAQAPPPPMTKAEAEGGDVGQVEVPAVQWQGVDRAVIVGGKGAGGLLTGGASLESA